MTFQTMKYYYAKVENRYATLAVGFYATSKEEAREKLIASGFRVLSITTTKPN